MKLPPHGKALAARLRFGNPPFLIFVCVGSDAWTRAKQRQESVNDFHALVLPAGENPAVYRWPVADQLVVIDVCCGPSDEQLRDLAIVLLRDGAETVTIYSRDRLNRFEQYRLKQRRAA